eukprot:Skav233247  [mRNA]  locus=scaffold2786:119058:121401:- [translate_table: standard]
MAVDAPATGKYCCYVLRSLTGSRTYTGITTDLSRRLRQHNGELRGGARATRAGGPWNVLCVVPSLPLWWRVVCSLLRLGNRVRGFPSKLDACRFEWRAKRQGATRSRKLIPVKVALGGALASRPAAEIPLQAQQSCKIWGYPGCYHSWENEKLVTSRFRRQKPTIRTLGHSSFVVAKLASCKRSTNDVATAASLGDSGGQFQLVMLLQVTWFGGAPATSTQLPAYITEERVEDSLVEQWALHLQPVG